jgi:hypothetical protein
LGSYSTTGTDPNYLKLSGGTMTGNLTVNANLYLKNNVWHSSIDNVYRLYFAPNEISYYCCGGNSTDGHVFYNSTYATAFKIKNNGDIVATGTCTATTFSGSGASLNSIPFTALTGTAPYYTKSEIDTSLGNK